jgi:hypothetical protein
MTRRYSSELLNFARIRQKIANATENAILRASSAVSTFVCTDVVTGLTTGTAYWFDIAIDTSNLPKHALHPERQRVDQ